MSRTRTITLSVGGLIIAALIAGKIWNKAHGNVTDTAYSTVIPVGGFVLRTEPFTTIIEQSGTLQGRYEAVLSAETGGQIEQILVNVGDMVRRGDALLRLDDAILEIESERALIAYEKAKLDFDRIEKLFNEKSISQSDFEGARLSLKAAEVQYRYAKKMYEDATIHAPFAGIVTAKLTEVGQMIDRGQPAFHLIDLGQLKMQVSISEMDIHKIVAGAPAMVFVEALQDSFPATVASVGARAMQGARTFPVELTLEAAEGLKSGMFARAFIFAGVDSNSYVIPRAATLPDVGRTVVFRAKNGKADKITVKVLGMAGDKVSVEGIASGDTLIVTGNQLLSQGSEISLSLQ